MLQTRNYSTETDVAISHLKDADISSDVTRRNLPVLAFKPVLLTHFILNVEAKVDAQTSVTRTRTTIICLREPYSSTWNPT